jgi:hypothetical protein
VGRRLRRIADHGRNAAQGSNTATSRLFGTATGAEYAFSPQTLAGFALAGGGTNFSVTGGGTGRSDLFQAGAYVRHNNGPSYITAALAYGWQDVATDRTVTLAGVDRLRAEFNTNAWSGRVEGGYRFVAPRIGGVGLTPYAAGQVTTFNLPKRSSRAATRSRWPMPLLQRGALLRRQGRAALRMMRPAAGARSPARHDVLPRSGQRSGCRTE